MSDTVSSYARAHLELHSMLETMAEQLRFEFSSCMTICVLTEFSYTLVLGVIHLMIS